MLNLVEPRPRNGYGSALASGQPGIGEIPVSSFLESNQTSWLHYCMVDYIAKWPIVHISKR